MIHCVEPSPADVPISPRTCPFTEKEKKKEKQKRKAGDGKTGRTLNVFGEPGFQTLLTKKRKKKVSPTSCVLRCPQTRAKQAQTEALINKSGRGGKRL